MSIEKAKDSIQNVCPECGKENIETIIDEVGFPKPKVFAPIRRCKDCGFRWTDWVAGEIYDKVAEQKRLEDKEVERLRNALKKITPIYAAYNHSSIKTPEDFTPTERALALVEAEQALQPHSVSQTDTQEPCTHCDGDGKLDRDLDGLDGVITIEQKCPHCKGSGTEPEKLCVTCKCTSDCDFPERSYSRGCSGYVEPERKE